MAVVNTFPWASMTAPFFNPNPRFLYQVMKLLKKKKQRNTDKEYSLPDDPASNNSFIFRLYTASASVLNFINRE